jgi:3-deoxy-manno-octulosonate cytidylyltransferase (CMP-KDO synthetase)
MKKIAMIPARYKATRFPYKLMQPLGEKSVIRHTYDNTVATALFDEVMVVTDSPVIFDEITRHHGKAIMSIREHESGSDRIAEAALNIETDIILNVQGDEPFIDKTTLEKLLLAFDNPHVQVASVMKVISDKTLLQNPNCVKVAVDLQMNDLFFSRWSIPFLRDDHSSHSFYEHIGVYAFRKEALLAFSQWKPTPLELAEKIECLRYLENGIGLKMVLTEHSGVKIDVPEDLQKAIIYLQEH